MLCLSVHCDEFRGRAHAQLAGTEADADGPGLRFTDTEPGREEACASAGYQASNWSVIGKYGKLSPCGWSREIPNKIQCVTATSGNVEQELIP